MTNPIPTNLPRLLSTFAQQCCDPPIAWAARETAVDIHTYDESFNTQRLPNLTLPFIQELQANFQDALTLRIVLDELPILDLAQPITQVKLDNFQATAANHPQLLLDFRVDKTRLVEIHNQPALFPRATFLFLFPDAFTRILQTSTPAQLEEQFWPDHPQDPILILLLDREVHLTGPFLTVLGGGQIGRLPQLPYKAPAPTLAKVDRLRAQKEENLRWDQEIVDQLTPYHLQLDGQPVPDASICSALSAHYANLSLLYLAKRTHREGRQTVSRFITPNANLEIFHALPDQQQLDPALCASLSTFSGILDWVYHPQWPAKERLPAVQQVLVHDLRAAEEPARFLTLLEKLPAIYDDIQQNWDAFFEGEFEKFITQVQVLEAYVSGVSGAYSAQIAEMIKSLSEAMLAAVAVLVGSLIASVFGDSFNPQIFRFGMAAYILYVAIFPLAYNMAGQGSRHRAAKKDFGVRRGRYAARLTPGYVDNIIGEEVRDAEQRFRSWFWATIVLYVLVIFLAILAAWLVPALFEPQTAATT